MPHIILEYSGNVADDAGVDRLLDRLHGTLGGSESFERDRIKTRAHRSDTFLVGTDRTGFLHATVMFSPGRAEAARRDLLHRMLEVLQADAAALDGAIATSVEIRQFEPGMYLTERDG